MQLDDRHRSEGDIFSRSVRQKLESFRLPVDETDWTVMQSRIRQEKRKRIILRTVSIVSAVAAVALLLLFIPVTQLPPEEDLYVMSEKVDRELPGKEEQENVMVAVITEETVPVKSSPVAPIQRKKKEETQTDNYPLRNEPDKKESEEPTEKTSGNEKEPEVQRNKKELLTLPGQHYADIPMIKKKRNKWQIGTGISGGGGFNRMGGNDEYDYHYNDNNGNNIDKDPDPDEPQEILTRGSHTEIQEILDSRDYSEMNHHLPVTFSFMVRNRFSDHFAIETGLAYTFLSSTLEQHSSDRIRTQIKQHYIGIPVNLIIDAWQYDKWHWYISAGFMLEKGIRLSVDEEIIQHGRYEQVERRSGIGGVQTSVQFATGIEYALSNQWSFYLEPRFARYFNNNQPTSIRTERPFIIGLGGGLRYSF